MLPEILRGSKKGSKAGRKKKYFSLAFQKILTEKKWLEETATAVHALIMKEVADLSPEVNEAFPKSLVKKIGDVRIKKDQSNLERKQMLVLYAQKFRFWMNCI